MYAAMFKQRWLLWIYAATLPLYGVIAEVGVQITPVLVASIGMLVAMAIGRKDKIRIPVVLLVFLGYCILATGIMSIFLPDSINDFPPLRGRFRWVSQILVLLLLYVPIFFFLFKRPDKEEINRVVDVFIYTVVFLVGLGFVQVIYYNLSGTDIFPIDFFHKPAESETFRSALADVNFKFKVIRMTSLGGGEPKHFGYTCVIAFNLVLLKWLFFKSAAQTNMVRILFLLFTLSIGILLTMSTQSYLLLAIDLVIILILWVRYKGLASKRIWIYMSVLLIASYTFYSNNYSRKVIEARTLERLTDTGIVEDFNTTILDFLDHNRSFVIIGTGLGNVHFWAQEYIPKQFSYYMTNSVFVAKAGILRLLSELGLIGMVLFFSIVFGLIVNIDRLKSKVPGGFSRLFTFFLVIVIVNYCVTMDASPYYIFAFALCFSLLQYGKRLVPTVND